MPDKTYNSRCGGKGCIRCWRNKLKHANKLKKKNFPKQNIWNIPIYPTEKRISYNDSSDEEEEEYNSNIDQYINLKIKTVDDYSSYQLHKIKFKEYKLIDIYDNYNIWLSKNKQLFEPNMKKFTKEFKQYISCKNNMCNIKLID